MIRLLRRRTSRFGWMTMASESSEVSGVKDRTMLSERRRFVLVVFGFAVVFTAVGRILGEDIALELQKTPTTTLGWRFIGWLVSGPPIVLAMISWHERGRMKPK